MFQTAHSSICHHNIRWALCKPNGTAASAASAGSKLSERRYAVRCSCSCQVVAEEEAEGNALSGSSMMSYVAGDDGGIRRDGIFHRFGNSFTLQHSAARL